MAIYLQMTAASHTVVGSGTLNGTAKQMFWPAGNYISLGPSEYGGLGYGLFSFSQSNDAVLSGGNWLSGAGVFAVLLGYAPSAAFTDLGFRCVSVP